SLLTSGIGLLVGCGAILIFDLHNAKSKTVRDLANGGLDWYEHSGRAGFRRRDEWREASGRATNASTYPWRSTLREQRSFPRFIPPSRSQGTISVPPKIARQNPYRIGSARTGTLNS